jgi:hypothetical protein
MAEKFKEMFGLDEADEDDDDYIVDDRYDLVCDQIEHGKSCINGGKCVIVDIVSGQMQACEHLTVEDLESFEANN